MVPMRILLFYDNLIRDYRGLLLLKEILAHRGHRVWVEPLWAHPEQTVRMHNPDTVIMGQVGEETTSRIAQFIKRHHIHLVINTTEYVCENSKRDNFFKFNFRDWNEHYIDLQVIVNQDYHRYIREHRQIKDKSKYRFIGCPRFDLAVKPEICARESRYIEEKYGLKRFGQKILYVSSFIFDDHGDQVSAENQEDIDANKIYTLEKEQKRLHHSILTALISDMERTNGVLLIKRHPWDKSSYYQERYSGDHVRLIDYHDYIVPLLQVSDAVLHTESTVAIEGWIQGCKTISVLPRFDGDRTKLKNHMQFEPIARDYDEIKALIDDYPFETSRRSLATFDPFLDGKSTIRLAELIESLGPRPSHATFDVSPEERRIFIQQQIDERLKTAHYLNHLNKNGYEYLLRYMEQYRRQIDEMYLSPIRDYVKRLTPRKIQLPIESNLASLSDVSLSKAMDDCLALLDTPRHEEATDFLRRLVQQRPDCAKAYFVLGQMLSGMSDNPDATQMYRQAVNCAPHNVDFLYGLAAHLFNKMEDAENALPICKQIYTLRPDHIENLWLLICINKKIHGKRGAAVFANAILEIEPCHPQALEILQPSCLPGETKSQDRSYQVIHADHDLDLILQQAQSRRHGRWCVHIEGLKIYCHDLLAFYMAVKDIFVRKVYNFDTDAMEPRIIDGGGHIGLFSLFVKRKYPQARITIFEPDPESLSLLKKNLAANGIKDAQVVEAGLMDHEGYIAFASDGSDGSSFYSPTAQSKVPVVRLGKYLDEDIDFLKLNIEGAEYAVIREIEPLLGNVRQSVIEYHGFPETGQNLHHILAILDRSGFRYLINDFDHQTNPATKPPFHLDSDTRFFLLVYAKNMHFEKRHNSSYPNHNPLEQGWRTKIQTAANTIPLSIIQFYQHEFLYQCRHSITGLIATIGESVPEEVVTTTNKNHATVHHFSARSLEWLDRSDLKGKKPVYDCIIITNLPENQPQFERLFQWVKAALRSEGTVLVLNAGVCCPMKDACRQMTDRALDRLMKQNFSGYNIRTCSYGNFPAAKALMDGQPAFRLPSDLLRFQDLDYQLLVAAKINKSIAGGVSTNQLEKKRILIYTLWRSGTHWISNMISEVLGVAWEYSDGNEPFAEIKASLDRCNIAVRHLADDPQTVLQWANQLDFDIIFLWRDIRDVIASSLNMRKHVEEPRSGLPPFRDMQMNDILQWEVDRYTRTYSQLLPQWIQIRHPKIHQVRFESMVMEPEANMRSVLSFLDVAIGNSRLSEIIEKFSFRNVTGRKAGTEKKESLYRKGVIGDWQKQLDAEGRKLVTRLHEKFLAETKGIPAIPEEPSSRAFGFDRGQPIDRVFIDRFLNQQRKAIKGRVLEIADNAYTKRFGSSVERSDVLNVQPSPDANIVGNLETGSNVPQGAFDCIILTQTLNTIFDVRGALKNAYRALKPGGVLLLTVPGISQISRYDMDRWGDYWRFSQDNLRSLIGETLPGCKSCVAAFGNSQLAKAFLDGLAASEINPEIFERIEKDYAILLAAEIYKPGADLIVPSAQKPIRSIRHRQLQPRILLYHRICDAPLDPQMLSVSPAHFESHLNALNQRFRVIALSEMAESLKAGKLEPDTVSITFDDGYADNLYLAAPLLEKYHSHGTVFVTAGFVNSGRNFWWDSLEHIMLSGTRLPDVLDLTAHGIHCMWSTQTPRLRIRTYHQLCRLLKQQPPEKIHKIIEYLIQWSSLGRPQKRNCAILNQTQLKRLSGSPAIEIGAHTMTHPLLTSLAEIEQKNEIESSKFSIESVIAAPVRLFSYPYGSESDFNEDTVRLVKLAGYSAAVSNIQKTLCADDSVFAIPRLLVRNWNGGMFARWLEAADAAAFERQSIAHRDQRLIQSHKKRLYA